MNLSFNRLIILIDFLAIALASCSPPDHEPPQLVIGSSPPMGDTLTVFYFKADTVSDNSTPEWQIKVRWDFDNDNQWDTDFSIKKEQAHRFPANGIHTVACEAIDEAGNRMTATTRVTVMPVLRDSSFIDSRDGKTYRAAQLFDRWWMSDNLMYGRSLSPGQFGQDNQEAEYYFLKDTLIYGGYYTWGEATLYGTDLTKGICPPGWRLPVPADLAGLMEICSVGDQAESYLFGEGYLRTAFLFSGQFITNAQLWRDQSKRLIFWMNNMTDPATNKYLMLWDTNKKNAGFRSLYMGDPRYAGEIGWSNDWGGFDYRKLALPVRCLKDVTQ